MAADAPPTFGTLLGRYRVAAGVTQEELAERAGLSVEAISALERGVRTRPRAITIRRLAEALALSADDRADFERAAHAGVATGRGKGALPAGDFLGALPSSPLVAREEECERIRSVLDAVAAGAGHLLLLSGERGAGKTRLLQEVMVEARVRGFLVLIGHCSASEAGARYYPFIEALSPLATDTPATVRPEVQRSWKRIQQLPATNLGGNGGRSASTADQQHLLTAVGDLLLLAARSVPVALLVDDLQWADRDSLKLLQHLARMTRSAPVLLAGAFSDARLSEEHPELALAFQTLRQERLAEHITVRRLSLEETTQLVATIMAQQDVSEEFASFVYRRTKGNPRLIDQLVRSLGGRLELQGEIGAGAMGRVFRAFDRTTEQTVAAKLVLARQEIDLDTLLRFQQEGAVLARLDHPNIVRVYDTFAEEHASCIIMELLDGDSLGQMLRDGPLPLSRAKGLALQAAKALGYAHSQEIVHRDIKPDNVMVLDGDHVKVTDFGVARLLQPDTSLQTMATTGMRMGTPLYMAPEQIEGAKVDGRTDVYGLGAMLYHMVTGRPPFEGNDALAVAVKHLHEKPVPPSQARPDLPSEWDTLILKALAKEPGRRFQRVGEMENAIEALPTEPAGPDEGRWARLTGRPRVAAALAALLVLATMLLTVAVSWSHRAVEQRQSALARKLDTYLSALSAQQEMSGTVLVARGGHSILSKGYGLADRVHRVPNGPAVRYPLAGVSFTMALVAALKLEAEGKLHSGGLICAYLPSCPSSWKALTVGAVVNGTSGLTNYGWSQFPGSPAQSLAVCESGNLDLVAPGRTSYQNCDVLVLGMILEKVTGEPWDTVMRRTVLEPAGMAHTGRLTDASRPPAIAADYVGNQSGAPVPYSAYFDLSSTAPDIVRYDDALFSGKLLSQVDLRTMLTPRDSSPDPGISDGRNAYDWKVGHVAGHTVIYTDDTIDGNLTAVNMRLPGDGTSILVISNNKQDDPLPVAVNLVRLLIGQTVIFPAPLGHVPSIPPERAIRAAVDTQLDSGLSAFGDHVVWFPNDETGSVVRISARTNQILSIDHDGIASSNSGDPLTAAADGKQVWIIRDLAREVDRLDSVTGKVVERVKVRDILADISIANGIVWGTSEQTDDVLRIDPRTHQVNHIGHAFGFPTELAAHRNSVWVSSYHSALVRRIDARTGRVMAAIPVGTDPESIAVGYGSVWVVNGTGGYVSRIDPSTNRVVAQISLGNDELSSGSGPCCHDIAVGEGAVWVAVHKTQSLVRIDPRTNRVTSMLTLPPPAGITSLDVLDVAVGDGSVWVSTRPHTLFRVDPKAMA